MHVGPWPSPSGLWLWLFLRGTALTDDIRSSQHLLTARVVHVICGGVHGCWPADVPDIHGEKSWGTYTIQGLTIKRLVVPPEEMEVVVKKDVRMSVGNLRCVCAW
jgi:hypothetical protein